MVSFKLRYNLLYVTDPAKSAQFYSELFGQQPIEQSSGFALFILDNGMKFGVWLRQEVEPVVVAQPGAMEIGFPVDDVDAVHAWLVEKNIPVIQKPISMDFGYTCMALDPDGHRLRFFTLHENAK